MTARRGPRDWAVDCAAFLLAAGFGLYSVAERLAADPNGQSSVVLGVDLLIGGLGCLALWLRRRWPVPLAVALVLAATFSEMVSGAMLIGLFTVAVHKRPKVTGAVFALSLATAIGYVLLRPEADMPPLATYVFGAVLQAGVVGWGLFVHHRRELLGSLRDRADRAETEARLRAEQAQREARDAIAREMHDVLGHRLSLLSVHAGALQYRPDANPEAVAQAAAVIRDNAHRALDDLREVIGVLRAPVGELPQPELADVDVLVDESRDAGMTVTLRREVETVPESLGRNVYRIIQEGLTNVRKHAPGAEATVTVTGDPGAGLHVEVRNTAGSRPAVDDDRMGRGLIGLDERVAVAGGTVTHGRTPDGGWRIAASLPWPS